MIRDCVQVIHAILSLAVATHFVQDVGCHVQPVDREVDEVVDLARAKHCVALVREAFEVDDQVVRRFVHFHLFLSGDVVFAAAAVPLVVARQCLFHREVVQAVVDGDSIGVAHLKAARLVMFNYGRSLD